MTIEEKETLTHRDVMIYLENNYIDDYNAEKQQLKNYTLKKV